mmetsp:Transcript_14322/g.35931  ORF Transcript_14322/g.35931 Transcript_14322/m.35931 type:complete len:260 (-) Transcript_14322:1277-2056(-)
MTLLSILPSVPTPLVTMTNSLPSFDAASTTSFAASISLFTTFDAAAFFSSIYFLMRASSLPRRDALSTHEMSEASTTLRSSVVTPSSSAAGSFSTSLNFASISLPFSSVPFARSPVNAVMRRMPFATASSWMRVKAFASSVFFTCVPPQSSRDALVHLSLSGSSSMSPMELPIESTRTGSGYDSPNTARSPLIAMASWRGTTCASTLFFSATCARQMSSTSLSCSVDRAPLAVKSKRSFASSTRDPFWSTPPLRTLLRA